MTSFIEGPEPVDYAETFERMARRIRDNPAGEFAGAMVIMPPSGEAISMLILNSKKDEAVFWSQVKTHAEMALVELQDRAGTLSPFGRR